MASGWRLAASSVCTLCMLVSCGLDEDYVVKAPTVVSHEPLYSNVDFAENYVDFTTNDSANDNPSFNYRGTEVYYKIYGNADTLQSNIRNIESANNSSSSNAADLVIMSYGYKELGTAEGAKHPMINTADFSGNSRVYIRLTSYQNATSYPEYAPKVIVGYTGDKTAAATFTPIRNINGKKYHFDFGRNDSSKYGTAYADNAKTPQSNDEDVMGTSSDGKWYVDLYAIALGNDPTFVKYYSDVLHLGTISIDAGKEDN